MSKQTITLYTMSWNGYWDKYKDAWCEQINKLNTQPDEIIIVSDRPLDYSLLKNKNVKNIVEIAAPGIRMASRYRNIATKAASSDWIVSADIDDECLGCFLDDLPNDSDIHAFSFHDISTKETFYPTQKALEKRLVVLNDLDLIAATSAIKKHVFDRIRYENSVHEDKVFYGMASRLNLKLSTDSIVRFNYSGFHTYSRELDRVSEIYSGMVLGSHRPVYAFWFSATISDTRKAGLKILNSAAGNLVLLNTPRFFEFENQEIPIHRAFKYLSSTHKSDYARAYLMYFYGGGYSDVKPNNFNWDPYFDTLYSSKYDAIGYAEKRPEDIAVFYSDKATKSYVYNNFDKFIGNGHYIFKPKTETAYQWLTQLHKILDDKYDQLVNNPGASVHISDPNYYKLIGGYPLEWNEIGGRILHRIQYENGLDKITTGMPFTNNTSYR